MTIRGLIDAIAKKHGRGIDLNPPATASEISDFEKRIGFSLPGDFKEFYSICNGFRCDEDIFNITSLADVFSFPGNYGNDWFYFSDYMISSEMWTLRVTEDDKYEILYDSLDLVLTSSLHSFLERFLEGNVFDKGGLMEWADQLK